MKINSIRFEDKSRGWLLEELKLNKLTLLVGASGVGKTQILKAIMALNEIGSGKSINGAKWYLDFQTINNENYIWEGEFEVKDNSIFFIDDDDDEKQKDKPKIIFEKLSIHGKQIIDRNSDKIIFDSKETIKLSQHESVINLLKAENLIEPANLSLNKLTFSDQSNSMQASGMFRVTMLNANKLAKKYNTMAKIQESDLDTSLKLFLISKVDKKLFNTIKERFIDIFPQVTDLKIAPLDIRDNDMPDFFKEYPFVQIKEDGVDEWIQQNRISSGMYRTLMHIGDLYLCSEGTVFLIDEFENSLGINCIDELTNDILKSKRQLQFVLTSHHPYIINNIHFDNWKLVTRKAGVVRTHNASEFNLGKSKHDAFMQLMQLEEYQTGTEQ
jgi:predicted ATPase